MDFAFSKKNYILLFVGLAFIASGFILLWGPEPSEDAAIFKGDEIWSFTRWVIAPILLATGFIIEIFAVMYKEKEA